MQQDTGRLFIGQLQSGSLAVLNLHLLGCCIGNIPGSCLQLGHIVPTTFQSRQLNDAVSVGGIGADDLAIHLANLELNAVDPLARILVALGDDESAYRLIGKC